jgi:hypothetical protein
MEHENVIMVCRRAPDWFPFTEWARAKYGDKESAYQAFMRRSMQEFRTRAHEHERLHTPRAQRWGRYMMRSDGSVRSFFFEPPDYTPEAHPWMSYDPQGRW